MRILTYLSIVGIFFVSGCGRAPERDVSIESSTSDALRGGWDFRQWTKLAGNYYLSSKVSLSVLTGPYAGIIGITGDDQLGTIVAGGENGKTVSFTLNNAAPKWETLAEAPFPIQGLSGGNFSGPVIFNGSRVAYLDNYVTNTWKVVPHAAPFLISGISGNNYFGVLAYGVVAEGGDANAVAYLANYRHGPWHWLPRPPFRKIIGIAGQVNSGPVVLGVDPAGQTRAAYLNSYQYGRWIVLPDLPAPGIRLIAGNNLSGVAVSDGRNVWALTNYRWGKWTPVSVPGGEKSIGSLTGNIGAGLVALHQEEAAKLYPLRADRLIGECKNLGSGPEACFYRYHYNENCRENKCSKLLIYFSGGQMSCPDPIEKPQSYLARYANDGYVAVCAKIYETEPESGARPFNKEASRVDLLVRTITSDPAIRQGWNGERVLFSGVSHGSAAAVVTMARNDFDATAAWSGTKTTGACFFDGVYNARESLAVNSSAKNTTPAGNSCHIYARAYGRYCPWVGKVGYPATWPHPDTCQTPDTVLDTVDGINVENFAIKNWKLIECGRSLEYCADDMVSAGPQWQLCKRIDGGPGKNCEFDSFPSVSHNNCGATAETMDSCRGWFNGL